MKIKSFIACILCAIAGGLTPAHGIQAVIAVVLIAIAAILIKDEK